MHCRHKSKALLHVSPGQFALQLHCHLLMPAPHGVHLSMHLHHEGTQLRHLVASELASLGQLPMYKVPAAVLQAAGTEPSSS